MGASDPSPLLSKACNKSGFHVYVWMSREGAGAYRIHLVQGEEKSGIVLRELVTSSEEEMHGQVAALARNWDPKAYCEALVRDRSWNDPNDIQIWLDSPG